VSWSRGAHNLRFGGSVGAADQRRHRQRAGAGDARHVHVPEHDDAPFEQLTINDVQQYSEPVSYGITSYELSQWMSVAFVQDRIRVRQPAHGGRRAALRPQTLTTGQEQLRAAPRLRLASGNDHAQRRSAPATRCTTRRSAPTRSAAR
jgi:hypothetical protein